MCIKCWDHASRCIFLLTIAVRSKCSLWTTHFDGFNTEPLVQIRMFCFPAFQKKPKQEEMRFTTTYRETNVCTPLTNTLHPSISATCERMLTLRHGQYLHEPTPTSWTTRFQTALRAPRPCGCTRSCCSRTGPPQSPSGESHFEK